MAASLHPSNAELNQEIDRLTNKGLADFGYTDELLEKLALKTWTINRLKRERNAVIPAHVYQRVEILNGIADFVGDSYKLSKLCAESKAAVIVFCGVRFMAETAKILNPEKTVLLPAAEAGCSLAASITGDDVKNLRRRHPQAPAVCYINTTAEVKAQCDVVVTSANARPILEKLYRRHRQIIFVPDILMAQNLAHDLNKKINDEMIIWNGTCIVHDEFEAAWIERYRKEYPGVKILAHSECTPALINVVDFYGGTGDMLRFVRDTQAPSYMLISECGLGEWARAQFPQKKFIPMCRLCPYMKATDLDRVQMALETPAPEIIIVLDEEIRLKAKKALDAMFALA